MSEKNCCFNASGQTTMTFLLSFRVSRTPRLAWLHLIGSRRARVCERQELLASDTLTLASRHSVTAGESCDGSTVADVCDIAWL